MAWKIRGMASSQPPASTLTRTLLPARSWPLSAPAVFLSLRVRAVPAVPVSHSSPPPSHPGACEFCACPGQHGSAWNRLSKVPELEVRVFEGDEMYQGAVLSLKRGHFQKSACQ